MLTFDDISKISDPFSPVNLTSTLLWEISVWGGNNSLLKDNAQLMEEVKWLKALNERLRRNNSSLSCRITKKSERNGKGRITKNERRMEGGKSGRHGNRRVKSVISSDARNGNAS